MSPARTSVPRSEAPPAGWYPDPRRREQLRWWDGTDWTPHRRPPPAQAELDATASARRAAAGSSGVGASSSFGVPVPTFDSSHPHRAEVDQIVSQVRQVTRAEIDRAADVFSARARAATREIEPLISQYSNQFFRFLRIALLIGVVLVVGWFVFQVLAQTTFLEWIGDRIDNVTDDGGG